MSKGDFISNGRISKKYELTPVLEDDEFMDDYFRNVLSDYTPEPPSRENEYKNKRSTEISGVMDRRYGRDTDKNLYKPDLFLGDMSRDPRSLMDSADLNGFRKHMEHRKDAIKINLLNDDDKSIHSKTMTHSESRKKKDEAFYRVKEKYTNFESQVVNHRPSKMLSRKKIERDAKSIAEYVINGHKNNYANFKDSNRHSNFQNKISGDRKSMNLMDYNITKQGSKFSTENERSGKGMNMKKMNSNIRKGMSDTIDSIDKERLNYEEKKNYSIASKKAISIERFMESNKMYKSKEQLTGRVINQVDNSYRINSSSKNKESGIDNHRLDSEAVIESISDKKSKMAREMTFANRINRNKEISPFIAASAESLSNKQSSMYDSKISDKMLRRNNTDKADLSKLISESFRISSLSGQRKKTESKENIGNRRVMIETTPFSKKSIIDASEVFDNNSLSGNKESISIYNYKHNRPELINKTSLLSADNNYKIEAETGRYGNTNKSKEIIGDGIGMRRTAYKYNQIGLANGKLAGDIRQSMNTAVSADRITVKAAGASSALGRKFVRNKIERDEVELDNLHEMTNIRKMY